MSDLPDPSTPSNQYLQMIPKWDKINTLIEGTEAMREAGTKYLPKYPLESEDSYRARLECAVLYNFIELTLNSMTGKPFSDLINLDKISPDLVPYMDNVDLQGNHLLVFIRNWLKDSLAKGYSHCYVDFPRIDKENRTLADDREEGVRPYLVPIKPENLIFAYAEFDNGQEQLKMIRIRSQETYLSGFETVSVEQIKIITPGLVEVYQERKDTKTKKIQWVKVEEYTYDLDFIPLVTFYSEKTSFMLSKPPLLDLADLNIRHFQSTADQQSILTVTRFPILAGSGVTPDEAKLAIGPKTYLITSDPQGRFYYVEHTGKAIEAGRQELLDLEERMANYSAEFLKKRVGRTTATAKAIDTAESFSVLQDITYRFEDAVAQVLYYMAKWIGKEDGGIIELNKDFGPDVSDKQDLDAILEARKNGDLSRESFLNQLKRRGILEQDFNLEENEMHLEEESESLLKPINGNLDPNNPDNLDDPSED
jgi:hypothetical protein